jgi:phenylalanine-4-hydroxylase
MKHHIQVVLIWRIMELRCCELGRSSILVSTKAGLTTTEAPFIEEARRNGQLYVNQSYDLYSDGNHEAWRRLYARMVPRWERYGNEHFLKGIGSLCLDPEHVPRLEDVNRFLRPLTGFQAKAVSGYIPSFLFFDCLRNRTFPTTITIRQSDKLDYLPEPDIFHDIAGPRPHAHRQAFRRGAGAIRRMRPHGRWICGSGIRDPETRVHYLTSVIKAMARFFWFTIEFGLMRGSDG